MHRRLFLWGTVVIVLVLASVFFLQLSHVYAQPHTVQATSVVAAQTPDPATLDQDANNAVNSAQNAMNTVNIFSAILGVVLTALGLFAALLAIFGFQSYREVVGMAKEMRQNLDEFHSSAQKTREALIYIGVGDRLMTQKNTAEALENYKKAGQLLPNDAQIHYALGRIYSGAGDYEAAIASLSSVKTVEPKEQARALKELGLAYRRRGEATQDSAQQNKDYDMAIDCLNKSVNLDATDADAFGILGGLYRRQQKYEQAFDAYHKAWELHPNSSYALSNLASLSWYMGKTNETNMYFLYAEIAASLRIKQGQPEEFWNYYDLALAQLAIGKKDEAKKTYRHATQITPGKVQMASVLSNLYLLKQAPQPLDGLTEVIDMLEAARNRA